MFSGLSATSDKAFDPLLQEAKNGDPHALSLLLEPYWEMVFRLSYRMTGHVEEAEDLAQEAFLRLAQGLSGFRGECAFRTWVYRVTLNVCLSARARKKPSTTTFEALSLTDLAPGPEALFFQQSFQERIREEIHHLNKSYREVVLLRLIEELSYEEIGEILRVSTKNAQLRFHRGLKQLRSRLADCLKEEE